MLGASAPNWVRESEDSERVLRMMSPQTTDRRGFLKGLGVLTAAVSAAAVPDIKEIVTEAIDDISTADDAPESPKERMPQIGEKFRLYTGPDTKCLHCSSPIQVSNLHGTYGGEEEYNGENSHIFLLSIPIYCPTCDRRIDSIVQSVVKFIEEHGYGTTTT